MLLLASEFYYLIWEYRLLLLCNYIYIIHYLFQVLLSWTLAYRFDTLLETIIFRQLCAWLIWITFAIKEWEKHLHILSYLIYHPAALQCWEWGWVLFFFYFVLWWWKFEQQVTFTLLCQFIAQSFLPLYVLMKTNPGTHQQYRMSLVMDRGLLSSFCKSDTWPTLRLRFCFKAHHLVCAIAELFIRFDQIFMLETFKM